MSKRLQVLLDESEFDEIRQIARAQNLTVAEWVRKALRSMRRTEPTGDIKRKLGIVRAAAKHSYPTGDITQMLADIESGYGPGESS
jgi:hypothetical protein